jgi:hypothetical protein
MKIVEQKKALANRVASSKLYKTPSEFLYIEVDGFN